jgi:Ni/Fe-hydrogenase 1 B-type cytochrome subunit
MILTGFRCMPSMRRAAMHRTLGFARPVFRPGMRLAPMPACGSSSVLSSTMYSAWLMDIKEHGSEISSMFSGYKFTVKKDK